MPPAKQKRPRKLTVAVTGPTGTFGSGLMPLLEADDRVERVIGIARSPFDPAAHGWSKLEYRQGDVRNLGNLDRAFAGADVVVHLAFLITGAAPAATVRAVNIEGTENAFHAAAAAGVQRFVYASSVAAYGFHRDNPVPMDESWPTRPATRLFYAQQKAELEQRLQEAAKQEPGIGLYMLRPPVVLGPNAVGGKSPLPVLLEGILSRVARPAGAVVTRLGLPIPVPTLPLQLIHEDDVGRALMQCVLAAGPPGAYNIAADGTVSVEDLVRRAGMRPLAIPAVVSGTLARGIAAIPRAPFLPPAGEWAEAAAHPAIMDTSKAKRELHWHPEHSIADTLDATLGPAGG